MSFPSHGLKIGDTPPTADFLKDQPSSDSIIQAQQNMIISASGWRKIFAASGNEEDRTEHIRPADSMLAGIIGIALADFLSNYLRKAPTDICLVTACDSRPTGPPIANSLMRVLLQQGIRLRYLFIAAAPETMAYSARCKDVDAFAYISASHNPIGHNGFKFGLNAGAVLNAEQVRELEKIFFTHLKKSQNRVHSLLTAPSRMETVFRECESYKNEALEAYRQFSDEVLADSSDTARQFFIRERIASSLTKQAMALLGELNGSARCLTIDRNFFEGLGLRVHMINDMPRRIVHRIVPEGESLNLCREELEKLHNRDPAYMLGYVPDNDGDRGNIVYVDSGGHARILEAQTVFALAVLSESAWLEYSGQLTNAQAAVVVNGPTSMRIDDITRNFGITCLRSEVGEANVTGLAAKLRAEGYVVRIMGEGSNGGCIIHPAAVRDPLNSISSILKILTIRDASHASHDYAFQNIGSPDRPPGRPPCRPSPKNMKYKNKGLFHIACERMGKEYKPNFTLDDVLELLPSYITTNAYDDIAIMRIRSTEHAKLKSAWEKIFLTDWQERRAELSRRWGIESWIEINTEGGTEKIGFGPEYRSGAQRGGLKILFSDGGGNAQAYMWMRGSATEALFRVLADVRGNKPELEKYLIRWQRSMVERADARSAHA